MKEIKKEIRYLPYTEHFSVFDKLNLLEKELEKISISDFKSNSSAEYLTKARENIKEAIKEEAQYLFEYE